MEKTDSGSMTTALQMQELTEQCEYISMLDKQLAEARRRRAEMLREARRRGIPFGMLEQATGMHRTQITKLAGARSDILAEA